MGFKINRIWRLVFNYHINFGREKTITGFDGSDAVSSIRHIGDSVDAITSRDRASQTVADEDSFERIIIQGNISDDGVFGSDIDVILEEVTVDQFLWVFPTVLAHNYI